LGVADLKPNQVTSRDIGFVLGPRLNAAGRLDSALTALELLSTEDVKKTGYLAQILDSQNRERQKITREVQELAEQIALEKDQEAFLLFAAHSDFNPGVVGLAASRLTDRYYRPAIVAYQGETFTRGSCRSIPEFHITNALDLCSDLLVRHGGHAAAAGFTVENRKLPALVARLQEIAEDQLSMHPDLRPTLHADAELSLSELEPDFIDYLKWLQPTGHKNPEAVFVSRDLEVRNSRSVGREGAHLKLSVSDGWITYDGIAFRQGYWAENMPRRIDIMYTFELNEYNGRSSLQLNIRDLKPAGIPD
jgi:single-stranded-DNA-specific exonuclease